MQWCSIEEQARWIDNDGKTTSRSSDVIHWLGAEQAISCAVLDDGTEWVNCRRKDYAFWVSRGSGEARWRLQDLTKSSELVASHGTARALRRSFYPDFLFRQDSLLDAIAKPYFKLISVEHEPTSTYPNLFKVVFDYTHPKQPSVGDYFYNFVQKGNLWLDADNCWVIVRLQAELLSNNRSYRELNYEFDTEPYRGVRLPVRHRDYDLDAKWQKVETDEDYVVEYRRIESSELDPKTMKLSHYGFAEPDLERVSEPSLEIHLESNSEVPANVQSIVSFKLTNVSSEPIEVIRVAAC